MLCDLTEDAWNDADIREPNKVQVLYRGNGSAEIRGAFTRDVYQFTRRQPVQAVDPRDVQSLIRTRLFSPVA